MMHRFGTNVSVPDTGKGVKTSKFVIFNRSRESTIQQPVSVLNLWVKFFAFDKVSISTITRSLESRLLTLALFTSFPSLAHAETKTRR